MKKSRFTEEQIAYALRQAEAGTPVGDVCRQLGASEATFYVWKKKFANLGVTELRKLRDQGRAFGGIDRHVVKVDILGIFDEKNFVQDLRLEKL